jgi:phosphoribosylamine--glycine ligase
LERTGVLVVSYGAREAAIIDALHESLEYKVDIYVVDKQKNPFNLKKSSEHVVVPNLDVDKICRYVEKRRSKINFGIVGPEKPIINGIRNKIEAKTGIPIICPTKDYAIESSKVSQRILFEKAVPYANPRYKVFNPEDRSSQNTVRKNVYAWLDEIDNQAVVKPDVPDAGKGVGVWGDHFTTREQLFAHFLANYQYGKVIIEEKLEGEESSFQVFCDGKTIIPLPETRDYKRAFDGDLGPNTGGMGSYKNTHEILPFMRTEDREAETAIVNKIFKTMKKSGNGDGSELRGIPFYVAFMHTKNGLKILENNSRPGDPEIINILPLLKQDFTEICFKILEGSLKKVTTIRKASVVTYKAPPAYGGYNEAFPDQTITEEIGQPIHLTNAYKLRKKLNNNVRIYPASMELRYGQFYPLTSRTVAVLGIGNTLEDARELSMNGIKTIEGGALWNRNDIADPIHIQKSVNHMEELRRQGK